jgi:hypothetical protein
MRHLITADVHGRYDAFMLALENARYDDTTDRLVLLGDLIDRGRQSREVLECIAGLIARGRDIIMLRGNHEDILQAFLEGKVTALKGWLDTCQGVTLLWSYKYDPSRLAFAGDRVFAHGREIRTHDEARAFVLTVMPEAHLAVLEGMRVYRLFIPGGLWGRDVFLCHAGLVHRTPTRETPQWMFAWGDLAWQNGRSTDFQPIAIYGHWHQPLRPLVRFKRICLAMDFSVAVMVLEEMVIVTSDGDCIEVRAEDVLGEQE